MMKMTIKFLPNKVKNKKKNRILRKKKEVKTRTRNKKNKRIRTHFLMLEQILKKRKSRENLTELTDRNSKKKLRKEKRLREENK